MNKEFLNYIHDNRNLEHIMDTLYSRAQDKKSWICPLCGKGGHSKKHKDGIKIDADREGRLHCFSSGCEFDGDILDLIQRADNKEFTDALSFLMDLTGFRQDESQTPTYTGSKSQTPTIHTHHRTEPKPEPKDTDRQKRISDAINLSDVRLKPLIEEARANITDQRAVDYLAKRGISLQTAQDNGVGYLKDNTYIGLTTGGKPMYTSDCLIFTDNYSSFGTRMLKPTGDFKSVKPSKDKEGTPFEDIPYMLRKCVLNKDKELGNGIISLEPIFLVEGQIDALSITESGGDAISLNGGGNTDKIIQIFKEYDIKRPLLVAMDNDTAGRKSTDRVYSELKEAGLEVYKCELIPEGLKFNGDEIKDANDYLIHDRSGFEKAIERERHRPSLDFEKSFNKSQKQEFINGLSQRARTPAVKTGFEILDSENFLDGGLYEGLYIVGAISSLGKTAIALQLADQIATSGQDVIYFSLEMSKSELNARSISRYTAMAGINTTKPERNYVRTLREITDMNRWNTYTPEEVAHLDKSINNYFKDTGNTLRIIEGIGNITADSIRERIEEHIRYRGKAPVVFIDYLQLLAPPESRSMTDKQITDANVLRLKQISRDYKIPIFTISSFNRDNYNTKVNMASFKESGAVEYGSDLLIGLERRNQPTKNGNTEKARIEYEREMKRIEEEERLTGIREVRLKILKNRNGQAGGAIIFRYFFRHFYFQEVGDEYEMNRKERSYE